MTETLKARIHAILERYEKELDDMSAKDLRAAVNALFDNEDAAYKLLLAEYERMRGWMQHVQDWYGGAYTEFEYALAGKPVPKQKPNTPRKKFSVSVGFDIGCSKCEGTGIIHQDYDKVCECMTFAKPEEVSGVVVDMGKKSKYDERLKKVRNDYCLSCMKVKSIFDSTEDMCRACWELNFPDAAKRVFRIG